MTEERDLTGFAIIFAAGVATAVFCARHYSCTQPIYASAAYNICTVVSYIICMTSTALLVSANRSGGIRYSASVYTILTAVAGLAAGLAAGFGNEILEISGTTGKLTGFAADAGRRLAEAADRIRFEDRQTNSLVKALLTGDRSGLSEHTKEIFRLSGASHILALSGLHLGIIYGMMHKLLAPAARIPRTSAVVSVLLILLCGAYTMATGAGLSITRAFIFITLRETARISFRSTDLKRILTASLLVHLATSPGSIASAGFQLSYSAMFGIAYIYPVLKGFWPSETEGENTSFPILRKIWDISSLSLSCQMTAGSVAWIYFGSFPKYFLITNLIAMPLSGILIPLSVIALACECFGLRFPLAVKAAEAVAKIMTSSLETISLL